MKSEEKYTQFALVREMMETPEILKNFRPEAIEGAVAAIKETDKVFLTGEGSSRIFPAKNARTEAMASGLDVTVMTEGGRQAAAYNLSKFVVFGASNSGQTKEVISLFNDLKKAGHNKLYGLTANENTKLESISEKAFILKCGKEDAVAATKSVAEQALFYQALLACVGGICLGDQLDALSDAVHAALTMDVPAEMTGAIANAGTIYFAGRNTGVAEELTLKTNEITHKKSDYLEGTYLVHGVEEVMNPDDVVILIDPFECELEKIKETLADGVGLKIFAVSSRNTIFPTLKVTDMGVLSGYVNLAAGWNILVEVGIKLGINLDKAERARKVGNEFIE